MARNCKTKETPKNTEKTIQEKREIQEKAFMEYMESQMSNYEPPEFVYETMLSLVLLSYSQLCSQRAPIALLELFSHAMKTGRGILDQCEEHEDEEGDEEDDN